MLVRAQQSDRASVDAIRQLIVNPGSSRPVRLAAVAEVLATTGPSEIHRADQTRVAIVSASLKHIDLGAAVREVETMVRKEPLAAGVSMHIGGQGEELAQSVKSLLFAFGLAIFLVYLVMASQFESLLHPFVILFTIPLAMVGAVLALLMTGKPISVVVFIGLILLVGLGDQERDHPHRQGQPVARRARCADRGRTLAPAADHHDHLVHLVRLPAAGGGDG